jgi:hypothetical protein
MTGPSQALHLLLGRYIGEERGVDVLTAQLHQIGHGNRAEHAGSAPVDRRLDEGPSNGRRHPPSVVLALQRRSVDQVLADSSHQPLVGIQSLGLDALLDGKRGWNPDFLGLLNKTPSGLANLRPSINQVISLPHVNRGHDDHSTVAPHYPVQERGVETGRVAKVAIEFVEPQHGRVRIPDEGRIADERGERPGVSCWD